MTGDKTPRHIITTPIYGAPMTKRRPVDDEARKTIADLNLQIAQLKKRVAELEGALDRDGWDRLHDSRIARNRR